jgi:hypothetical protein
VLSYAGSIEGLIVASNSYDELVVVEFEQIALWQLLLVERQCLVRICIERQSLFGIIDGLFHG